MVNLETKLTSAGLMKSFWKRHVDDFCVTIGKYEDGNSQIMETEKKGQLPF